MKPLLLTRFVIPANGTYMYSETVPVVVKGVAFPLPTIFANTLGHAMLVEVSATKNGASFRFKKARS